MISLLHTARRIKFSVKVDRDDLINRLSDCSKISYSSTSRFPSDIYAVNISRGTTASIFHRILNALDYSERELENMGDQSSRRFSTINDQKVQFIKAVDHLLSLCYSCTSVDAPLMGIHNRISFESTQNLLWTDLASLVPSLPPVTITPSATSKPTTK